MRTQDIENTLTHLSAPPVPQDLQARCLATIPASAQKTVRHQRIGGLGMKNLRVAAAVTASVVLGLGFWSTRPDNPDGKSVSGSIAFAQTLEAMRKVEFCHYKGRQFDASDKNHRYTGWRLEEGWFDAQRGLYMETKRERVPGVDYRVALAEGSSEVDRHLKLPDGMYYSRGERSTSVYFQSHPADWQLIKRRATTFLLENLAAGVRLHFDASREPKPVSSRPGDWKGREATILTFEIKPPPKDAAKGVRKRRAVLYVDPGTRRLMAQQDFHIAANALETLVLGFEIDYSQPDASLFDPARFTKGAKVRPAIPPKNTVIKKNPKKGTTP